MIKVFYGEDRVRAQEEIKKYLGDGYEVFEGEDLAPRDLPSLFMGGTLFSDTRAILVRDMLQGKEIGEELPKYLDSPHKIVFWETKLDKRSSVYKALKERVEFREFARAEDVNKKLVFEIYRTAKRDGARALELLEKIENEQEPMMLLGLMVAQAIRDYDAHPGAKEKRVLRELSNLDMQLKSAKLQPWVLIKSFLIWLSTL